MSIIVVITGPSGAGKSTLTEQIHQRFSNHQSIAVIGEDDYYLPKKRQPLWLKETGNYDHPEAFEHSLLVNHVKQLKQGNAVDKPAYCYKTHDRKPQTVRLQAPDVLIVEGLMLLQLEDIKEVAHLTLYVDLPQQICFERRLKRDIAERGRTVECVTEQYQSTVLPMYEQYIKPFKNKADITIDRLKDHTVEFRQVEQYLITNHRLK